MTAFPLFTYVPSAAGDKGLPTKLFYVRLLADIAGRAGGGALVTQRQLWMGLGVRVAMFPAAVAYVAAPGWPAALRCALCAHPGPHPPPPAFRAAR